MNRPVHFEIHAADPDRAIRFYSELLSWKFQAWGPPGMYWVVETGASDQPGINGGLVPRRGGAPQEGQAVNAFVCTVDVASAKEMLAKAVEAGGTEAHPVMAVPGVGWLAYARDPEGNILGMMQNDPSAA